MIKFDKEKDKIAIIAPASGTGNADQKLEQAGKFLAEYGFKTVYEPDIFAGSKLPYFAAEREVRIKGLKKALSDPEVKIIWAFRGGYGTGDIVFDCLDIVPTNPKILIGFSDITALHILFNQHYKMPSIHSSVLTSLLSHQKGMFPRILNLLEGKKTEIPVKAFNKVAANANIKGEVIGGNLAVFCNMIGTKLHPITKDKIIILEDVNEKGYQIHRYLVQMKNAGLFDQAIAVVFADFIKSNESLKATLEEIAFNYIPDIACFKLSGIGHGDINHPVILGEQAIIEDGYLLQ